MTTSGSQLSRLAALWALQPGQLAAVFGVSVQKVLSWRRTGVPAPYRPNLVDLVAATDLLEAKVKRDRIPGIVRQPVTLLALAESGNHAAVRSAVARMFNLRLIQP